MDNGINELIKRDLIKNKKPKKDNPQINYLSLSGASTKAIIHPTVARILHKEFNYIPNNIAGISAGSLMAVPIALQIYDEAIQYSLNLSHNEIFNVKPLNDDGGPTFNGIARLIFGKPSMGEMDNLRDLIAKVISEDRFYEWKNNPDKYANCYVMAVSIDSGRRKVWNLRDKDIDYNKYIDIIMASSTIPVLTEPVKIDGEHYVDGGLRHHNPSPWFLDNFGEGVKEMVSVYSRPDDYGIYDDPVLMKALPIGVRTLMIQNTEISKRDEFEEKIYKLIYDYKLTQLFLGMGTDSIYDTDKETLKRIHFSMINETRKKYGK